MIARKPAFLLGAAGLAGLVCGGFVKVSPNRIMPGVTVSLFEGIGPFWFTLLMLLGSIAIASSLKRLPGESGNLVGALTPCVILPALLALAGASAADTFETSGATARVSLASGFWFYLFFGSLLVSDGFTRARNGYRKAIFITAVAGVVGLALVFAAGWLDDLSLVREYINRRERFCSELGTHLTLSLGAVTAAVAVGVPLGYLSHVHGRLSGPTFFWLNTLQTIPSLALFSILIPLIAGLTVLFPVLSEVGIRGIGAVPAVVALTLYSILPVARNTLVGFRSVDPAMLEAGRGMGMTRHELLWRVELPLASPIILNGLRIALVQVLGLTAVAALIGAGGLGFFIFQGLGQAAEDLILLGAIPTVLAAVVADSTMHVLIAVARPEGMR